MSRFRIYIKPFNDNKEYTEFIEVTDDVLSTSVGDISREIDSTEYNAGVFKYSSFGFKLANETGKYSDVDVSQSIFRYKRSDSVVRITWSPNIEDQAINGTTFMIDDATIFEGLLNDDGTTLELSSHEIKFQCFGYESIMDKMEVPFSDLVVGDTFSEILYKCLNQDLLTTHVAVDAININCPVDSISDDITAFENMTVKEAIDEIVVPANAVLYINNNELFVTSREESTELKYTFYGQASNNGIENVNNISSVRRGQNRIFNLWAWEDTTFASREQTSINKYGVRKKTITSELITNSTKINNSLEALKNEFGSPHRELELTTSIKDERLGLELLDKVNIDYPTVFFTADESLLPLWGKVVWGEFKFPFGQWSLSILESTDWKIIGIKYKVKNGEIIYKLREVLNGN